MRYPPEHKVEARARLVRASAAVAKRDGFAGSGVDAFAAAAGVTTGSLYKHFAGKGDLLQAIACSEIERTSARFAVIEPRNERQIISAIAAYLSLSHVEHPASGCVLPALSAEVARAPRATRTAFERALAGLTAILGEKIGDEAIASAIVSQCVGAVMIARCLASDEGRQGILDAARAAASESVRRALART